MTRNRLPGPARILAAALVLVSYASTGAPAQEPGEKPLDVGIEEEVGIDYVLVDFIVLDAQGRPVPDLELADFKLKVGGKKIQASTLDQNCKQRASGEAGAPRDDPATAAAGTEPLRLVLAFDYDHMDETAEVFDRAQDLLNSRPTGGEEHMLVSFSEVVRFETPFTSDLDELRWALRRMRNDRDLYARHRQRVTQLQFYARVRALFDLLERWPGRKTVVLFSGPFARDGFVYDEQYRDLAALSAATRTTVYPVDTMGLRPPKPADVTANPHAKPESTFGGPPELRRLANETGGRMTSETNDISVAYAQAHQDMSCFYMLGFRDPGLKLDKNRGLTIKLVGHKDLRVVSPDLYVVRSEEQKRDSLFETAGLAPHMFESERIRAELIVTGAQGENWKSVVGTEIRLEPGAVVGPGETWDLRGYLRRPNGTIVQKFARAVTMPEGGTAGAIVAESFEAVVAPPGDYALSVVLSDPRGEPFASTRPVTLPGVPRRGPFLIGPILGRNGETTFEPLMRMEPTEEGSLDALTVFCLAGGGGKGVSTTVTRRVADLAGNDVLRLEDVSVELKGDGLRCHPIIDSLGAIPLAPGRYELGAAATASDWMTDESLTEFTVRGADR
jgi:VWFA-related protein